jgi:hypothetical protein
VPPEPRRVVEGAIVGTGVGAGVAVGTGVGVGVAPTGVAVGREVAVGVGVDVPVGETVGVAVGELLELFDRELYANTLPTIIAITTIAKTITYVLFIFFTWQKLNRFLLYEGARHKHYSLYIN